MLLDGGPTALTAEQRTLVLDGLTAFEGMAGQFNSAGALGQAVDVLGQGMGAAFDTQGLLGSDVIGASRGYFQDQPAWTLEGWAEHLRDSTSLSVIGDLAYDTTVPDIVAFSFSVSGSARLLDWSYDLGAAFESWDFDTFGFATEGNLAIGVDGEFSAELTMGVDLTLDGGSPKGFFLSGAGLALEMGFSGSAPLAISLDLFTLETGVITGAGVGVDISLTDPDGDGRIYTDELAAGGAGLVTATFSASSAGIDVPLALTAQPGVASDAFAVAPVLRMTAEDFVTAGELSVGQSNLGALVKATAVSPQAIATAFLQLGQYLGGVNGLEVMRQELPLVSGVTLGDILDIPLSVSEGVNPGVLSVNEETGEVTPLFEDFGGFATALDGLADLIHVDPNARELTIGLDYTYDYTSFEEALTFSAGVAGLALSTEAELTLDGSLHMQMTLGVQIAPDQVLDVLPVGEGVPTEDPAAGILNGQLGEDATFTIYLDGWDDHEVTVSADDTSGNANLLDLVADVNTALAAAGLGEEVAAYLMDLNVLGREVEAGDLGNPEYEGTGLIGLRTVTAGEYWALRVQVDEGDPAATSLGFPEDLSAKPGMVAVFLDDTSLDAMIGLTAAEVTASGSLGIVDLTLSGSASIGGSASGSLVDPDTGDGRIDFADFTTYAADGRWSDMLDLELAGSGAVVFDSVAASGLGGLSLGASPCVRVLVEDLSDPHTLTAEMEGLGNVAGFQGVSVSQVLEVLAAGTEMLSTVEGLAFLQYDLPVVDRSVTDILGVAAGWAAAVEQAQSGGEDSGSLNLLDGELSSFFGSEGFSNYALALEGTDLKFSVDYALQTSRCEPFQLDLAGLLSLVGGDTSAFDSLTHLVDASAATRVSVSGQAAATLALGLDLSDPASPRPFVYDESGLSLGVRVAGSDLDFHFSLGPLSVAVKDGWGVVDADGDPDTVDFAGFTVSLTDGDGDGRHYLDDAGEPLLDDLGVTVDAAAGLALPVYFPTDSIPLGGAGANEILLTIDDLERVMASQPASADLTAPNLNSLFSGVNILQVLNDPAAVLDGLRAQFNLVGDSLQSVIEFASLPLVGDALVDAVGFVQDLGDDLLGAVRTTLNRALDGETPTSLLREALFDAFGGVLLDSTEDGEVTVEDVVMEIDDVDWQYIEYRLEMGDTLLSEAVDFGGIDILPLDLDGQLAVSVDWAWSFGFGLDVTDGFYAVATWEPELSLGVGVTLPEDLHGELFFLDADVTSMDDAGTAVDRGREMVFGTFSVDLAEPSGDGRLTLSEVRANAVGDLISAGFAGGLAADLRMTLSVGGSDAFPQFRAVASIDWTYDKTFGQPGETTPLTVDFTTVELNLGSVVNGFLRPIFEQIDEIVDPLRPVLDFLDTQLPVINMTVLDVASAFGYGSYADFISAVSWIADMAALVTSVPTDDFWLPMGSFRVTGDSGTSAGGAITPLSEPDFDAALAGSAADGDMKSFLAEANGGNGSFTLNLLQPSTVFDLLMGNDATLLTFSIPNLEIAANYSQYFPVYGPLGMRLSGSASATLHLGFGYDTYGIRRARETGNWSYVLDGFYVSDRANADGTGADTPEVMFDLGFSAAAELNLGIASGGVSGGLYGSMDLDLADPDNDGKLRMTELWTCLVDPRKLFDISILVTAEVRWYLKIGWGRFSKTFDGTLASVTLYQDQFLAPREEVLAKEAANGQIVLNVGEFAADRLYSDTADGAEVVTVSAAGGSLAVAVGGSSQTVAYQPGDTVVIHAGAGADTITIDSSVSVDVVIDGGAGNDVIRHNGSGSATIDGGAGDDEITGGGAADTLSGGAGADRIEGGGGADTLDGGLGNDTLDGGAGDDTFVFTDGFGDDTLADAAGTDTVDFSATAAALTFDVTAARLDNDAGDSAAMGFLPERAVGSSDSDTIYARDEENTWSVTGADAGDYNGLVGWQSFEQLVGRSARDAFVFADGAYVSDRIDGGEGVENGESPTYAQQVAGDVIDLSAYASASRWQVSLRNGGRLYLAAASPSFTSVENLTGGSDRDYLVLSNDQYIDGLFDGNGAEDRVEVSDYELVDVYKRNVWDFTGVDQGGLNERTAFTEVENFTGGKNEDVFYLYPAGVYQAGFLHAPAGTGGGLTGSIDAEDRNDTLSASPVVRVSQPPVLLADLPEGDPRLDEAPYDVVWEITGANSGTRTDDNGEVTFENLQNIEGSPQRELFILYPGGSMDGFLDGKGGQDALVYGWGGTAYPDPVSVAFQNAMEAAATGVGGGVINIEAIVAGTSDADRLTGPNLATSWQLTGANAGTMDTGPDVSFEGFDSLTGGTGADTIAFTAAGGLTGALDGGGGADVLDLSALAVPAAVSVTGADTGQAAFNGNSVSFSGIESVSTGSGDDTLTFAGNAAELSGQIDTGAGDDGVVYSAVTADRTIHVDFAGGGRFGRAVGTTPFQGVENVTTGSGDDRVVFAGGASLGGTVDLGAGADMFDHSAWTAVQPVAIDLQTLQASGTGGFAHVEQFLGGAAPTNHLTARDVDNAWTIDGIDDGSIDDGAGGATFYNFQQLTGGSGSDTFDFADLDYVQGPIDGAGGEDTIDFAGYGIDQQWCVTAPDAGYLRMTATRDPLRLDFSAVEHVVVGDAANTVTFRDGATLTSLQGGANQDALDLSACSTPITIDLAAGTMTPVESFGGFEQITGSAADDVVVGRDADTAWYVYEADAVYYDATTALLGGAVTVSDYAVDLRGVESLTGGSGVDTFCFADGAGVAGDLTGTGPANTASWWNYTTDVTVDLENATATGIGGTWADVNDFAGGVAADTLIGPDGQANTWSVQADDAGELNAGAVTFQRFGGLTGGTGDDEFVLADGATLSGAVDGAAGANTLDYSAYTAAVAVDLEAGTATGLGTFADIDHFAGGTAGDRLTGPDADAAWTIDGADAGTLDTAAGEYTFTGVESVAGGSAADTFALPTGGSLAGTLDGGDGWDHVSYAARAAGVVVDRQAGTATATGGYEGIEEFTGTAAADDQLTGLDAPSTWHLAEAFGGDVNGPDAFAFHGFEGLVGGSDADGFLVTAATESLTLAGGDGADLLDLAALASDVAVDIDGPGRGQAAFDAVAIDFREIESVSTGSGSDALTFTGDAAELTGGLDAGAGTDAIVYAGVAADRAVWVDAADAGRLSRADGTTWFTAVESVTTGAGDDTFVFAAGGALSGAVQAGAGADTFDYTAWGAASAVTVDLQAQAASGTGGFTGVETFLGGASSSNELMARDADNTWSLTGEDGGSVDDGTTVVTFADFAFLTGGAGVDSYSFAGGGSLSGALDGGAGADVLAGPDADAIWHITADDAGTVGGMAFEGFGTLIGGIGVDRFLFDDGKVVSGSLDGGAGQDHIDLNAYTTVNTWTSPAVGVVRIETNFGTFTYEGIEGFEGNMSVFLFTHYDLQAAWEALDLPAVVVPGESMRLDVTVTNLSNVPFRESVDVAMYASADAALDPAEDVFLGTVIRRLNLRQDQHAVVSAPVMFPVGMDFGDYYLIAKADMAEAFEEVDEVNNTDVTAVAQTVSPYFGRLGAGRNVPLSLPQNDGVLEFRLTGPGWGMVNDEGVIELHDTTRATTVRIAKPTGEAVGELAGLTADSDVGWVLAPGMSLIGDIELDGGVRSLTLGDVSAGAQNTITIGASSLSARIILGAVTDADIVTDSPVALLRTGPWRDTDIDNDDLMLPSAHRLDVGGQMDVDVASDGDLLHLAVDGDVTGALDVAGRMADVRVAGDLSGSLLVDGDLGTVRLEALSGRLRTRGQFGSLRVEGDLSGEAFAFRNWRVLHVVGGDLTGQVGTNETLYSVVVRTIGGTGGALTGSIEAGDRIRNLQTHAASSGVLEAPRIDHATLRGGFDGVVRALGGAEEFEGLRGRDNIGHLRVVGGDLLGTVTADSAGRISAWGGDLGADVTIDGRLVSLRVTPRRGTGGNVLAGTEVAVTGLLRAAYVAGDLAGTWSLGGDLRSLRQNGTVTDWTLQTPGDRQTDVRALRLGEVQQLTLGGQANIGSLHARRVAAGTIGVNSIRRLVCPGDFQADLTLAGAGLDGSYVLRHARVSGGVDGVTWQLAGSVGWVSLYGSADGAVVCSTGSMRSLRADNAADLKVLVGVAATALDDGTVSADEVLDPDAELRGARIGRRRGPGDTPAASDVLLAAPTVGWVTFRQTDDLGAADGSALWTGNGAVRSVRSIHADPAGRWVYRAGGAEPWAEGLEPVRSIA